MCFLILKGKIYMNTNYLKSIINDIFLSDSPSGYYKKVDSVIYDKVKEMGYDDILVDDKGMVRIFIKGESSEKSVGIGAHADTLGLMVRSISSETLDSKRQKWFLIST